MKNLTKSLENYLVVISKIVEQNGAARVRDVARMMNIGAASVSEAVKNLTVKGYVKYQPYGVITLTEKGRGVVAEKSRRCDIIREFLKNTLMLEDVNSEDIEFAMPDNVLERFVSYLSFMQKCSCKEPKWLKSFQHYLKENTMPEKCLRCTEGCKNCCGNK